MRLFVMRVGGCVCVFDLCTHITHISSLSHLPPNPTNTQEYQAALCMLLPTNIDTTSHHAHWAAALGSVCTPPRHPPHPPPREDDPEDVLCLVHLAAAIQDALTSKAASHSMPNVPSVPSVAQGIEGMREEAVAADAVVGKQVVRVSRALQGPPGAQSAGVLVEAVEGMCVQVQSAVDTVVNGGGEEESGDAGGGEEEGGGVGKRASSPALSHTKHTPMRATTKANTTVQPWVCIQATHTLLASLPIMHGILTAWSTTLHAMFDQPQSSPHMMSPQTPTTVLQSTRTAGVGELTGRGELTARGGMAGGGEMAGVAGAVRQWLPWIEGIKEGVEKVASLVGEVEGQWGVVWDTTQRMAARGGGCGGGDGRGLPTTVVDKLQHVIGCAGVMEEHMQTRMDGHWWGWACMAPVYTSTLFCMSLCTGDMYTQQCASYQEQASAYPTRRHSLLSHLATEMRTHGPTYVTFCC